MPAYPPHSPSLGYLTDSIRRRFIDHAMRTKLMPENIAPRVPDIISLVASQDKDKPIHFWQLYSILGKDIVLSICTMFYSKVYKDENNLWFRNVFERISPMNRHVSVQANMWLDCFGGGNYAYHGGEGRLNFHHHHNAFSIMTEKGALLWISYMEETLDEICVEKTGLLSRFCYGDVEQVTRIRRSINTFLGFFMDDYAEKFNFESYKNRHESKKNLPCFGERNPAVGPSGKVLVSSSSSASIANNNNSTDQNAAANLLNLSETQIREMKVSELKASLIKHKVDITNCVEKCDLVEQALKLC